MKAATTTRPDELPLHYEPVPGRPPLFVALDRDLPKRLVDRLHELVLVLVVWGFMLGFPALIIRAGLRNDDGFQVGAGATLLLLFGSLLIRSAWTSRRAGIVVDARGVHRVADNSTAWSVFPDEIVDVEPIPVVTRAHRAGVHSQRHFGPSRGAQNAYLVFDTPMGPGKAVVGVEDLAALTAAVEAVRGTDPVAWRVASPSDPPVAAPEDPDVEVRVEGDELVVDGRGVSASRRQRVRLDGIREVRVTTDPVVLRELRARRSYNVARKLAKPGVRAMTHPGSAWRIRWVGKSEAAGAVILVLDEDGVVVVSTDQPDHVASQVVARG